MASAVRTLACNDNDSIVTSQGERVLRDVGFQYTKTNIKGDMSRFLRNCEDFILIPTFCVESSSDI